MTPNVLIFAAVLGWGLWGVFDKLAVKSIHPTTAQIVHVVVGLVTVPVYLWLFRRTGETFRWEITGLGWAFGAALMTWIASLASLYVLQQRGVSQVVGYTCVYPLVTLVIAASFLGEPVSIARVAGMLLIVSGIWLLGQ